jgi:hypothetical protein
MQQPTHDSDSDSGSGDEYSRLFMKYVFFADTPEKRAERQRERDEMLEHQFAQAKALWVTTDPEAHSRHVQQTLGQRKLHDAEALSLILGAVQRRLATTERFGRRTVTDVDELQRLRHVVFEPAKIHKTCHLTRCRMLSFRAGEWFYAHEHQCYLQASGDIFVCPIGGLAHCCGEGLACSFLAFTPRHESRICQITGRTQSAGMGSARQFGYATVDNESMAAGGGGGGGEDNDAEDGIEILDMDGPAVAVSGAADSDNEHAIFVASRSTSKAKRRRRANSTAVAAAAASSSGMRSEKPNAYNSLALQLREAITTLVYGHATREALVDRLVDFHQRFHTRAARCVSSNSNNSGPAGASTCEPLDVAWLMGKVTRIYLDSMGSRDMLQQVERRLGYVPNMVSMSEQELRNVLHQRWQAHMPCAENCEAVMRYFSAIALEACALFKTMPGYDKSNGQPKKIAIAILCAMRNGVCYEVLYDATTGRLVMGFTTLSSSSTGTRVCARRKERGTGMRDAPYVLEHDTANKNVRCREVWLLPSHPFLHHLPSDDVITQTPLPGGFFSKVINASRQVEHVHSSIFDSRNPALATLTIDELEARFCLHRHVAIDRMMGCHTDDANGGGGEKKEDKDDTQTPASTQAALEPTLLPYVPRRR